ncbi:hypothetical protein AVEN_63221-1 [Araneus ventricosus]|uniref:Uncharacterized protein n=1 Tax=Araneus ventricosus TaxID=182803 RepID=A0A4Y2B3M7_ARAVE|nr:hypothetical protein AVEN_63221-1 [Araneus ventricosus]
MLPYGLGRGGVSNKEIEKQMLVRHYATTCPSTYSFHMRKSAPDLEPILMQKDLPQNCSRTKIRLVIKFINAHEEFLCSGPNA